MTQVSRYFSTHSLPWAFALCAVTACSSSDNTSTTTGPEGTAALTCQGDPPLDRDSVLVETPSTGFAILRSHSKRNSTSPDGPRCRQTKEIPSK
jgi:hypothetical protein